MKITPIRQDGGFSHFKSCHPFHCRTGRFVLCSIDLLICISPALACSGVPSSMSACSRSHKARLRTI